MFKTIKEDTSAEIVEKKSRFIANVFYIENVEEAEEKIKEIKKKYFDARHNCFAYRIATESKIVERFSDDGEPSGTAGAPMLVTSTWSVTQISSSPRSAAAAARASMGSRPSGEKREWTWKSAVYTCAPPVTA